MDSDANAVNGGGILGESTNLKLNIEDHGQSTSVGNGDIIDEELSSPCSKEGSIYEDMVYDDKVPPSD